MLTYPGAITLSKRTLTFLSRQLRAHQVTIGNPWRKLPAHRQALLVLAHLRNGDTYQRLAAGFGVGVATASRYIRKAVDLLAAQAPSLTAALWALTWTFNIYAILAARARSRLGGRPKAQALDTLCKVQIIQVLYHDKTNSIAAIYRTLHISRATLVPVHQEGYSKLRH